MSKASILFLVFRVTTHYLIGVGDSLSALANRMFFFGDGNETISGRCYRVTIIESIDQKGLNWGYKFVNFLFRPFQENHCFDAFWNDVERARSLTLLADAWKSMYDRS